MSEQDITNQGEVGKQVIINKMIGGAVNVGTNGIYYPAPPPGLLFARVPPFPTHTIVGRDKLVDQICQQLINMGSIPVMALSGQPGVGKTTLATLLAYHRQLLSHFTGGVFWSSLGPNPKLDKILETWASALGISLDPNLDFDSRIAGLQAAVAGHRYLFILDDVWKPDDVTTLRRVTAPGCVHLVTTRSEVVAKYFAQQRARSMGELNKGDALKLLRNLCPRSVAADIAAIKRLITVVGGLPLALTLIGGYLATRDFFPQGAKEALKELLANANIWLTLHDSENPDPLDYVIGLSIDYIPIDLDRDAFLGLAAFAPKPASFSLNAAIAISGADITTITNFVERNLLEQSGNARLAIHQTIAAVSAPRTPNPKIYRERHSRYFMKLMDANPADQQASEADWEQIKHALQWRNSSSPDTQGADVNENLSSSQTTPDQWRNRIAWLKRGIETAHNDANHKHEAIEATIFNDIGVAYNNLGEREQALTNYEQALSIHRELGDYAGEGMTLNNIGYIYINNKNWLQAKTHLEEALAIARRIEYNELIEAAEPALDLVLRLLGAG